MKVNSYMRQGCKVWTLVHMKTLFIHSDEFFWHVFLQKTYLKIKKKIPMRKHYCLFYTATFTHPDEGCQYLCTSPYTLLFMG